MSASNVPKPPEPVNVFVHLTDGEHVHDSRTIHPDDLAQLNALTGMETGGEMWWVAVDVAPACRACNEAKDTAVWLPSSCKAPGV